MTIGLKAKAYRSLTDEELVALAPFTKIAEMIRTMPDGELVDFIDDSTEIEPAPVPTRKPRTPKTKTETTTATVSDDEAIGMVLAALRNMAPQTSGWLANATKLPTKQLGKVLSRLETAGKIEKTGAKRGTRYARIGETMATANGTVEVFEHP